jgi:hypothetical protein
VHPTRRQRSRDWQTSTAPGLREREPQPRRVRETPQLVVRVVTLGSGWQARQIPAGSWLSRRSGAVPPAVLALAREQDRVTIVVDSDAPGEDTDQAVREAFAGLAAAGQSAVRLVLPSGASRYGVAASRAYGLDIIAADSALIFTPHGYLLAADPDRPGQEAQPQWWQFLPGGDRIPAGWLSPSPAWEHELAAGIPDRMAAVVVVHRVQAGLALHPPGTGAGQAAKARTVWPDPERLTVVVGGTGAQRELLLDALAGLLLALPGAAKPAVRLWWPRAGADPADPALHELARQCRVELIAPSADVSALAGYCGLCHGVGGAAPWVRFTGDPPGQPEGPLYPVPGWQRALGQADLGGLPRGLAAERVAAGLAIYREEEPGGGGNPHRGLAATARSIIPDPERACIIAAGDAGMPGARRDLEAVLERLPEAATQSLRIVLAAAGAGGGQSYAQDLARRMGSHIIAPAGGWTATPDGRLHAVPAGQRGPAGWQEFSPHARAGRHRAAATASLQIPPEATRAPADAMPAAATAIPAAALPEPAAPAAPASPPAPATTAALATPPASAASAAPSMPPEPATTAGLAAKPVPPQPAAPQPAAPPASGASPEYAGTAPGMETRSFRRIVPPHHDEHALTEDRKLYRESSPDFHMFAVAVRRILSQRPGLRAGAAGREDAVLIDFAALLDLLATYRSGQDQGEHSQQLHPAWLACAACGLRRLPSFRGPVYYPANLPAPGAAAYRSGHTVVEPAFIITTSSPAVSCNGHGDFVIWSETGKRIAALAEEARPDEVMFGPGSTFKVLQVDTTRPAPRIFLRELPARYPGNDPGPQGAGDAGAAPREPQWDVMDMKVFDHLGRAAALRDGTPPDHDTVPPWGSAVPPLGLDDQGRAL